MLFADSVECLHVSDQTANKQLPPNMAAEALNTFLEKKLLAVTYKI